MSFEFLLTTILIPITLLASIAIPILLIEKITNFIYILFPHLRKEKIQEVVSVTIVVVWIILGAIVSIVSNVISESE